MTTPVLPGSTVNIGAETAPSGVSTATGRLFTVGITAKGPTVPARVGGLTSYRRIFGRRSHYTTLDHALAAFWAAGGGEVYISRVVGPAATAASVTLQDAELADTLEITARDPGPHGDDLSVGIDVNGDTFDLTVTDGGVQVETWRGLESPTDAADRLADSRFVRATDLASESSDPTPDTGTFDLTGGDDDRASIDDDQWADALDRFDATYGPGQVAAPGRDTTVGRSQLVDHAETYGRVAFLDGSPDASVAELTATVTEHRSRNAAMFAPPLRTTIDGRTRTIPASMVAAGLAARLDRDAPTGHLAPEQARSVLDSVSDVTVTFDDDDHADLNGAGVNVFRATRQAGVLLRGWRSTSLDDAWVQLSQVRYIAGLAARLSTIADRFVFRTLTPATIADFGGQLAAELKSDFDAGALFGDTSEEAYTVDVSDEVNPPDQIGSGQLAAAVAVKASPFAERIVIDIVKAPLTADLT